MSKDTVAGRQGEIKGEDRKPEVEECVPLSVRKAREMRRQLWPHLWLSNPVLSDGSAELPLKAVASDWWWERTLRFLAPARAAVAGDEWLQIRFTGRSRFTLRRKLS